MRLDRTVPFAVLLAVAACGKEDYADCGGALPANAELLNYEATLDAWAGPLGADGGRQYCALILEGQCADSRRFLARAGGFDTEVRYFDDAGALVAGASEADIASDHCDGGYFYPSLNAVHCEPLEWASLCDAGPDSIWLPFGDGETPAGIIGKRAAQP
jgi:hypothetical protein